MGVEQSRVSSRSFVIEFIVVFGEGNSGGEQDRTLLRVDARVGRVGGVGRGVKTSFSIL